MELSCKEVRAGLYGLSALQRERALAGRPVPEEVAALQKRLTEEWSRLRAVSTMSPTRQQTSGDPRESDAWSNRHVGTVQVARMLGATPRWVQRHADGLGGETVAGRLVFREYDITEYIRRNQL